MKKIKDRVILGSVSALIPAAIGRLINGYEYRKGWTDEMYAQSASSMILPKSNARSNSVESKIIGSFINNSLVCLVGTITTYFLSVTGRDKAVLKGAGVGAMFWITNWGLTGKLG